jgi:hypothetical protein
MRLAEKIGIMFLIFSIPILAGFDTEDDPGYTVLTLVNKTPGPLQTRTPIPSVPIRSEAMMIVGPNSTIETNYRVCEVLGQKYYASDHFVYHMNEKGHRNVYAPFGSYYKPSRYPNWQFLREYRVNRSLWYEYEGYFAQGKLPDGSDVACSDTDEIPKQLYDFIQNHRKVLKSYISD